MFRELFLILFFALNIFPTFAAEGRHEADLSRALKKIAPAVSAAGTIDYKKGCASCATSSMAPRPSTLLYSKDNDQKIELTPVSEEDATTLFNELAEREDIPFGFPMDGCYARAHKMVRILEDRGIIAGKAFVEGELYVDTSFGEVGWGYHVAPVVMVKKGSVLVPYVFDPSLFQKPVPQTEWKAKMLAKSKSKFTREYYTNRFSYDPDDRTSKYNDYSEDSLVDMDQTNRNYSRMLYLNNTKKKK